MKTKFVNCYCQWKGAFVLRFGALVLGAGSAVAPANVAAAGNEGAALGAALGPIWGLPFAGILLSIALLPLLAPSFWHHHYGKLVLGWALAFLVPFAFVYGLTPAWRGLVHAMLAEYLPFVILLTALFTVAGGIYIRGNRHGSPGMNCMLMAIGAVLSSFMGTTGASMLMIRPLIGANAHRHYRAHIIIFFIFIVSNVGGALTPLGDPPLFLGFLKGVPFFWTLRLLPQVLLCITVLLLLFFVIDTLLQRREQRFRQRETIATAKGVARKDLVGAASRAVSADSPETQFGLDGKVNLVLLLVIMGLVLMSGVWRPGVAWNVYGTTVELQQAVRDVALVVITLISLRMTPAGVRAANQYSFAPMLEVAKLFFGIFLTIIPVIAMLQAGLSGAFAPVIRMVTSADGQPIPLMYFWATGVLSAFLDNAPTYLVFFNLAGGDAQTLTTTLAPILAAISAGAVFMGANTYIGNAPNLMVKAVAEERGIQMPGFFGYMLWALGILGPLFGLVSWLWYAG